MKFREVINGLLTLTIRLEIIRGHLAERFGVSGPQYSLLMAVGHLGSEAGISVGRVARFLHVTSAFVATESNHLARAGLIEKRSDSEDRRSVLLHLSPLAIQKLAALGPEIRSVNDCVFGSLARSEFDALATTVSGLLKRAAVVLHSISAPDEAAADDVGISAL